MTLPQTIVVASTIDTVGRVKTADIVRREGATPRLPLPSLSRLRPAVKDGQSIR